MAVKSHALLFQQRSKDCFVTPDYFSSLLAHLLQFLTLIAIDLEGLKLGANTGDELLVGPEDLHALDAVHPKAEFGNTRRTPPPLVRDRSLSAQLV